MRGEAGRNNFEMKFVDASGDNVWWFRRANFQVSGDWQQIRIKRRQIEFAWGPTNDRTLKSFAGIEFVVAAGEDGGKGSLWFDRLALKPIQKPSQVAKPTVTASSTEGSNVAARVLDGQTKTAWQSDASGNDQTLTDRPAGRAGVWRPARSIGRRSCMRSATPSSCRATAKPGTRCAPSKLATAAVTRILLPESEARFIRLTMPKPGRAVGISEIYVRDLQFGASPNAFIESLAKDARRGCYPRAYSNEQTYWTIIGVDGDTEESMLSEDGAVEVRKGSFSIEPFIRVRDKWLTWADMSIRPLAGGQLSADSVGGMETFRCHGDDDGL